MTNKERKELKNEISKSINLGNGRYSESDLNRLKYLSDNSDKIIGQSRSQSHRETVKDTRGNWDSMTENTYTGGKDSNGLYINQHTYENNDGYEFNRDKKLDTGRELLNAFSTILELFMK